MKKDEEGNAGRAGWGEPREGVEGTERTRSGRRGPQAPQRLVIQNPHFSTTCGSLGVTILDPLATCCSSPIERAVILSDSTSALQALSNYNENNCLRVQNCRELMGKIKGKIIFQWVPSHCGLWGNERADVLAKKGTGILQNFRRDLTLHSAKLEIKRIFRESFRLTAFRVARDKPWSTLCKKSHGIPSFPRAAAVAKFRLLTGQDCLRAHLFHFNLVISPICVLCDNEQDMTAAHLDECSALK
ncbi:uncharacterized protein LOC103524116 [Trichonephila clavipes]|nr:uncharacterized protein LOC103524116 [Trichonephila clavipes]